MESDRQAELLLTERWSWLREFIQLWYADPISADDASPKAEIQEAEARLGVKFPTALTEWYELVGGRLDDDDWFGAPLEPRFVRWGWRGPDLLNVWTELIGVWCLLTPGGGEDPESWAEKPDSRLCRLRIPLSQALRVLTTTETTSGAACSTQRIGPLGKLSTNVRGGVITDPEEGRHIRAAYPPMDLPLHPHSDAAMRGLPPTTLMLDWEESYLQWATCDQQSFDHLQTLVELDSPGGKVAMLVAFDNLDLQSEDHLRRELSSEMLRRPMNQAGLRDDGMWIVFHGTRRATFDTSDDPQRIAEVLVQALPQYADHLVIASRPAKVNTQRIHYPPTLSHYTPRRD